MNIPVETKPALWGAAGGAIVLSIVGFSYAGWVTGSKAETAATMRADTAVVTALAPVCMERFMQAGDASVKLEALKKIETWSQGDFVEKGGWARMPGTQTPAGMTAVAKACATLLVG
jgi:hypothetical protein